MPAARAFRFGVMAAHAQSGEEWIATARRVESLGYETLVMPDVLEFVPSAFTALAVAATATTRLRVGTYVLANDYRNPLMTARDASTLDFLSGGRFELGIGAGRPGADADYQKLGIPYEAAGRRIERLEESLATIKKLFRGEGIDENGPHYTLAGSTLTLLPPVQQPHPPILVAGTAQRILSLAGREADIVGIGGQPDESAESMKQKIAWVRDAAGARFDAIELNVNVMGIGDQIHPQALRPGMDEGALRISDSPIILLGSVDEMIEKLQRRREELGISYILTSDFFMDALAPVVKRLAGR